MSEAGARLKGPSPRPSPEKGEGDGRRVGGMLRGILTVGGWTMASRVLGLLRDTLLATFLGAGLVADAFFVANRLPNLFRRLFGEGAFNAAFVPSFTGLLTTEGRESAAHFAEEAMAVLAFWLIGISVLAEVFMPQVMGVLAPGFVHDPAKFQLVVTLGRITFPYMPLICLVAVMSGILNGLDRFAAAAAAPVLYNLTSIGFMLGLLHVLPTAGHAMAVGVSVSGLFQLALVVWAVRRAGLRLHVPRPRLTPRVKTLLRRMGPGLLGAGVTQLNLSVDVIIGSLLPAGTVSVLYYADRINQLPLGVLGTAIGTALLPTLSRQVLLPDRAIALTTMNRAMEYALLLTLPAALGLAVAAEPILASLFGYGAFTAHAVQLSAGALRAYALGLPAFVLVKVLVPGFFARGDTGTPVKIGLISIGLNLALNLALMRPLQAQGPALASALAAWFNVGGLVVLLARRGAFASDAVLRRRVLGMAIATAAMGVVVGVIVSVLPSPMTLAAIPRAACLVAELAAGGLIYALAGQALGAFDARALLRRRGRPGTTPA